MRLQPPNIGKLMDAITASFNETALSILLMTRFGHATNHYVGDIGNIQQIALAMVKHFQATNEIEVLVALLRDARPKVVELAELAQAVGLLDTPDLSALQVISRPTGGGVIGHDPRQFRADLAAREDTICRIEVNGERYGTGTLVGPDLVLTNYHVVKSVLQESGLFGAPVVCEFDYRQAASGYATPGKRVAATAAIAFSEYAQSDLNNGPVNQSLDFLDYALLRLPERVGDAPIVQGGDPRGFTHVGQPAAPPLTASQGILVLQHPNGNPLRLDVGAISEVHETRVRHTANTFGGSSGSPVFDGDLAFAALHHAGYDWPDAQTPVNQAIPIGLIVKSLATKGVPALP